MKRFLMITALLMAFLVSCKQKASDPVAEGNGTVSCSFEGTVDYDEFFTAQRLRLDFVLAGDKDTEYAFLEGLACESEWAGSPDGLIDPFGYGEYYFEAFSGEQLIFSKGFCSLFQEWSTTAQASEMPMAMSQTMWMPFPKGVINVKLYHRNKADGRFAEFYSCTVDPDDKLIRRQKENDFKVVPLMVNGDRAHKVDLLFVAEGYTAGQMAKFRADAQRFTDYMFTFEPYSHRKDDFNIWLLESTSENDGVDIPQDDKWVGTVCESNFYTFYIDRYLTISNHKKIASAVSGAPFDALFIIANESKYGGGGIYNSYALGTSDNKRSNEVFIHEFGHSFAGLGDEYYDSEVAYEDYYPAGIEPWEPNITTLVNFDAKWAEMVDEGVPVPTPASEEYAGVVGVYEGAGYMTYGCYRPFIQCRMLNNTAPGFCPVCQRAIEQMIDFYIK
jgi:IgA Peptidase M64.